MGFPKLITKRNMQAVEFDKNKITNAIIKASKQTGEFGELEANKLTEQVLQLIISNNDFENLTVDAVFIAYVIFRVERIT